MNDAEQRVEPAKVVGPDEGESYWQPVPANGFIRNIFSQASVGARGDLSVGTQTLPPGCFIREHTHARQEEIIYVVEGKGVARIDGVEAPLEKGSAVFVGMNRKHHFLNPHAEPTCVYACPHDAAHRVEPNEFFRWISAPPLENERGIA